MKCPICKKPTDPTLHPFCSARCKNVDLGRWLDEAYRISRAPSPDDESLPVVEHVGEDDPAN